MTTLNPYEPDDCDAGLPVCPDCGWDAVWADCNECGGAGELEVYDDDPMWYEPGDTEPCYQCGGDGGWWFCANHNCKRVTVDAVRNVTGGLR